MKKLLLVLLLTGCQKPAATFSDSEFQALYRELSCSKKTRPAWGITALNYRGQIKYMFSDGEIQPDGKNIGELRTKLILADVLPIPDKCARACQ